MCQLFHPYSQLRFIPQKFKDYFSREKYPCAQNHFFICNLTKQKDKKKKGENNILRLPLRKKK